MKKNNNFIVVADIGSSEITCMMGQPGEDGKMQILAIATEAAVGVERGCVKDVDSVSRGLTSCVEKLEAKTSKTVDKIYVGYNARSLRVFSNTFTETYDHITLLTGDKLDQLKDKNRELPLDKEEAVVSVLSNKFVLDGSNSYIDVLARSTKKIEATYLVSSGKREWVTALEKVISRTGYKLAGVIVNASCSAKSVLSDEEFQKGTAVVDLGAGTCSVAICSGGVVRHQAILPIGGNVLDNDLMQGCNVDRSTAVKLKENYGGALTDLEREDEVQITGKNGTSWYLPVKQIAYVLESRLDEIIENVDYQIELAGFHNRLEGGVVLTGGLAQLKNISQLFASRLGVPCRLGKPTSALIWPQDEKPRFSYSVAAGMLKLGKCNCGKEQVIIEVKEPRVEVKEEPEAKPRRLVDGLLRLFDSKDDEGERM